MLSRLSSSLFNGANRKVVSRTSIRGMATEKDIRNRIASTKSIEKITKSMKMVAAAKLKGQQKCLQNGEAFGRLFTDAVHPMNDMETPDMVKFAGNHHMFVVVTTDRGLCGGVNSNVLRSMKVQFQSLRDAGKKFSIFVIGDKGKTQMSKFEECVGFADQCFPKEGVNFSQASAIAARITNYDFDTASVTFNMFRSAIKYDTVTRQLAPMVKSKEEMQNDGVKSKDPTETHMRKFDVEEDKDEVMNNMYNFSVATTVFGAMQNNVVSEFSARMNAMDNASNNAGEMIDKLSMIYNRARQSRITTELIEIISGAESLKSEDGEDEE